MLSELFEKILREYPICKDKETFSGNPLAMLVRRDLPNIINTTGVLGVHHIIRGSVGQGKWANVPWVAIMDTRLTTTTQRGIYIVYLFAENGSSLYLTLNQGCTDIILKKGRKYANKEMVDTADKVRMMIPTPGGFSSTNTISLGNDFYENGCIFYKQYRVGSIPDDETLVTDLRVLLDAYARYCELTKSVYSPVLGQSYVEVREDVMNYKHRIATDTNFSHNNSIKRNLANKKQTIFRVDFSKTQMCERTYPVSCIINGAELSGENWGRLLVAIIEWFIAENNPNITKLYKQSLYQRPAAHPFIMNSKIDGLHCAQLSNGYWIDINHSIPRLVVIIGHVCVHCGISLSNVVITYTPKGKGNKVHLKDVLPTVSTKTSVIDIEVVSQYIHQQGLVGTTTEEIIKSITIDSRSALIKILERETNIIALPEGRYIHKTNVVDLDEAADTLLRILRTQFRQFDGYSNYRLLFDAAKIDLSLFMNDNAFEDENTIYAIAKHLFTKGNYRGNQFVFTSNAHIWEKEPEYPQTIRGILIHRARMNNGRISRSECEVFLDQVKMGQANINQIIQSGGDSTFYQYASGEYLLSEILHIDKTYQEHIKRTLGELFENNSFVIPRDIDDRWYDKLPGLPLGLTWTPLFLQEVLIFNPVIGYKPLFALLQQSRDTVAAAFVPTSSDITFADIVSAYIARSMDLPMRMGAEDLRQILRESGMIEGNELIFNMHRALNDYRFAWSNGNKTVHIHN
jgi:hypothetical protein